MSTELSNGVIIPEEYSDDWYDEMSINLRKLNDVITAASDNATDIQRLDTAKANQTDLTALTSRVSQNETDIIALQTAVSGALKREIVQTLPTEDISTTTIYMIRNSQSSGTNIYDEYMYINSQWELIGTSATDFSNYYTKTETDTLLSGKADDNSVVHTSGNETISGDKNFVDNIIVKKIVSNVSQLQINAKTNADSVAIVGGDSASDGGGVWVYGKNTSNKSMVTLQVYDTDNSAYHAARLNMDGSLTPTVSNNGLGSQTFKWVGFNGINPGALSMPDFSNAIDISSYITVTGGSSINNNYTPPADGYISVNLGRTSGAIGLVISNGKIEACVRENTFPDNHRECGGFIPVQKNDSVVITSCLADSIIWAYFIPCQGNV